MIIEFVSRGQFMDYVKRGYVNDDCAMISISCSKNQRREMEEFLAFYEIDPENVFTVNFPDNERGIDHHDAKKMVEFILKNNLRRFTIHCLMGVSRSGAVAKFINDYFEVDDLLLNNYQLYNKQVYNKLNSIVGRDLASYYEELEKEDKGLGVYE
ncbi:MAG: hypothetical protein R3230_00445 [Nitrosopumilaceae archaeon]|nr:hypothetical protein [Nitrosopumilaceae archaeon]